MKLAMFHSIRWSVQIWHGVLLIVVLAAFGLTTYEVAWRDQLQRVDAELAQRLQMPFRPMMPPPGGPAPMPPPGQRFPGQFRPMDPEAGKRRLAEFIREFRPNEGENVYYIIWDADGTVLARSPGAPDDVPRPEISAKSEPRPGPRIDGAHTRGEFREAYQRLPWGEALLVGRSIVAEISSARSLALILTAAGCAVLLLGLAGGWWLATRAIRPIEAIGKTATRIAAGDLSQRIDIGHAENELAQLADVLNTTFARLETAFSNQARFTADASHELRTPVSVILAQTQTALARERSAGEYREALQACGRAADRMRRLTESLLALTRLDAGEESMRRESMDLARVLRDSVELVRPIADQKRIGIICDLPALPCQGDAERLGQVATNLLSNAVQFNREDGEIRVAGRHENGSVYFTVADTGEGIPSEDVPHIFERFYRVDKARSRAKGRTGLGLAICKAIVEAHGGAISVKTAPEKGSAFTVRLPRTRAGANGGSSER